MLPPCVRVLKHPAAEVTTTVDLLATDVGLRTGCRPPLLWTTESALDGYAEIRKVWFAVGGPESARGDMVSTATSPGTLMLRAGEMGTEDFRISGLEAA